MQKCFNQHIYRSRSLTALMTTLSSPAPVRFLQPDSGAVPGPVDHAAVPCSVWRGTWTVDHVVRAAPPTAQDTTSRPVRETPWTTNRDAGTGRGVVGVTCPLNLGICLGAAHPSLVRTVTINQVIIFILFGTWAHPQKILGQIRGVFSFG